MALRALTALLVTGLLALALAGCGGGAAMEDTARLQEETFQGSGSVGPFEVQFKPILADGVTAVLNGQQTTIDPALSVPVDGVEQQEGVDFDAVRDLGRITFRRIIPPTAVVQITYFYEVYPTWHRASAQ